CQPGQGRTGAPPLRHPVRPPGREHRRTASARRGHCLRVVSPCGTALEPGTQTGSCSAFRSLIQDTRKAPLFSPEVRRQRRFGVRPRPGTVGSVSYRAAKGHGFARINSRKPPPGVGPPRPSGQPGRNRPTKGRSCGGVCGGSPDDGAGPACAATGAAAPAPGEGVGSAKARTEKCQGEGPHPVCGPVSVFGRALRPAVRLPPASTRAGHRVRGDGEARGCRAFVPGFHVPWGYVPKTPTVAAALVLPTSMNVFPREARGGVGCG